MFKNLDIAYQSFRQGLYTPDLLAMNPKEWNWFQNCIRGIDQELSKEFGIPVYKEVLPLPKYIHYKLTFGVFKKDIPPGEAWMWRMEPELELRQFKLSDPELPIRILFKFDDIFPDVRVFTKRLEQI